jgi:multidrug efflux pump
VPLSSVVTLTEQGTVRELSRIDRQSAVTVEAGLAPGAALGDAFGAAETAAREALPSSARLSRLGEGRDLQETGGSLYLLLGLVMVLVYLVLAGQFESFVHPFVILLSVPVSVGGGVLTAWALGLSINIYTQIALVLLVGLTAKNAILLIEFANQQRSEGQDARGAMAKAAEIRLRPILITSIATIIGAIPLMLESGAGAEARRTVGLVTTGGLLFGTLLTLFIVPTAYVLLGRFTSAPEAAARKLAEQEAETEDQELSEGDDPPGATPRSPQGRPA